MRLEDYTPHTICTALEGRTFRIEELLRVKEPALRLLMMPSFNPELCITLTSGAANDSMELTTFREMFWHSQSLGNQSAVFKEECALAGGVLRNLARGFVEMVVEVQKTPDQNRTVCDGMGVAAVCCLDGNIQDMELNVGERREFRRFIAHLIQELFPIVPPGECRNAVACAGGYVDLNLPIDTLPKADVDTRLLVLGEEQGRQEVADILNRKRQRPGGRADEKQ